MVRYLLPAVIILAAAVWAAERRDDVNAHDAGNDKVRIYNAATGTVETVDRVRKTEEEWKAVLTPEQFHIMREKGTERPFTGSCPVPAGGKSGIYRCAGCGTDLFRYDAKFESGTGWPSFWEPVSELNVRFERDTSFGRIRTEVLCARCDAHLGHVFDDGPPPTGKRYCINAAALKLAEEPAREKAVFAAGCFWGVESAFRQLLGKGVVSTRVGYTGGHTENPTYEQVCSDATGHAEAVEVEFDPDIIGYDRLLEIFWSIHDPTTPNRQGPDVGSQYRSAVFYTSEKQRRLAEESKQRLEQSGRFKDPIVTEIVPAGEFYPAEDYHQQYYEKRGVKPSCGLDAGS